MPSQSNEGRNLLSEASIGSFMNEVVLQCQCITTWGSSCFRYHITYVTSSYKTIFFVEKGNPTHQYTLEIIPLFVIWTIASIRLSSHSVWCEMERRGTSNENNQICTLCCKQCDTMCCLCSYSTMLSTHLQPNLILIRIYLTILMCHCDIKSHYSLSHVLHENVIFWSHWWYLTSKDDNNIYLSPLSPFSLRTLLPKNSDGLTHLSQTTRQRFTHNTMYVAPSYKPRFLVK